MPWMPETRTYFDMVNLKGKVWAVETSSGALSKLYTIDYNTRNWTRKSMPIKSYEHCLTELSPNQFMLIGGYQNGDVSKNVMMKI